MKLPEVIFLAVAIAFVIMGVHQIMTVGFSSGYWALMLALVFFFLFTLRRRKS